ncbi:hypothetical protein GUITHDRAFT_144874 [Guillardia theta CCMP2712]|uniref:Cyclic nucleotide-binding domain-containing protein n=1 Tax=Guillardia theta (strain CCMP2712) TaxID=905079 RepID=L1IMU8_GUITC|nr:hypothetical protein GUITHDRAFT_144874 [Guillardia theta CCMP2712]EKX37596.1 hypothetical protein GUITHDRAFT_144874 [Guillardia theta CCMP2712]|eukprot:XP_005824576.1 hypothetical protein GUITHDRAFT_144874 [Guillardia theta CCMP2712]
MSVSMGMAVRAQASGSTLWKGTNSTMRFSIGAFAAGFFWTADSCVKTPTLYFDVFVDSFFLLEILLNFVTGTFIHNEYVDDLGRVLLSYVQRSLFFDLITSIPASYVELATLKACERGGTGGDQSFRLVRMLKPVRLLKILRTFRAISMLESDVPTSGIISKILRSFRLPSNITRILKVLLVIALIEHASASMFWLVKEHSNSYEDVLLFLEDNGVFTCNGDHYFSSPCLLDKYVIATYFVVTIFSTIGFGDISATNSEERIICIVLAYIAALAFGALLAEIQDAVMQMNQQARDLSSLLNRVTDYLREKDVPADLQKRVLSWVRFKHETSVTFRNEHDLVRVLPSSMAFELRVKLHESLLMGIPLFANLQSEAIERFVIQIWDAMSQLTFPELVPIFKANNDKYHEGLYLVVTGTAIMVLSNGRTLSTLHPGNSFGEDMLLVKDGVKPKIELCSGETWRWRWISNGG